MPALATGLEVINKVVKAQDGDFLLANHELLMMIIELTFASKRGAIGDNFAQIFKALFKRFYPQMAEFDQIRKIFSHLHDFIAKHISSSEKSVYGDTLGNGHPGSVSLALQVLFELREDFPQYVESGI